MRKEFNELVETMKRWDLFQKDDEVDMALNDLGAKIDEVEKRIECAVRSAKEINESISKYTDDVDNCLPINMSVNDHDLIQNCSDDVRIALDLNDDMSIVDNWYDLFQQPTKEEPIAVGNIEYDFPEEVFTIGNVDNTEIIGDIYESTFLTLCDLNVIICEGNERFPIGHGKTNYVITNKNFTNMVKNKQIDLSKVPIKKKTFMSFESSWGNIACDEDGNVIEVIGYGEGEVIDAENYLFDIVKFDLVEYGKFCESINITMSEFDDILIVGFWKKDGTYEEADMDWRKNMLLTTTFDEIFKSKFLENLTAVSITDVVLALLAAFILGVFIYFVYKKTFQGVIYSEPFNMSLLLLTMLTTFIILAVTSNIVFLVCQAYFIGINPSNVLCNVL
jgi:hypothetical protein